MFKKILKIIYKILFWILTAMLVLVCVLCGYIVVRRYAYGDDLVFVFGYSAATVLTGSMEPTISEGDLVIIKACDEYEEGEIITFYDYDFGGYITHRIILVEGDYYTTRGDANTANESTYSANIAGKVVLTLGGAGSVVEFIQTPLGIICVVGAVVIIWLVVDLAGMLKKSKKEENDGNENEKGSI